MKFQCLFFFLEKKGKNKQCRLLKIQSTLVIPNSKGHCEILRDFRTSTYQICRIEEIVNRPTIFNKFICNLTPEVK